MRSILSGALLVGVLAMPLMAEDAAKPQAKPAAVDPAAQDKALAAFEKKDYKTALPLLIIVANQLQDQPDKAAAIQEKIRVCQKNLLASANSKDAQEDLGKVKADNVSVERRKPHVKPKDGEVYEVGIKELGNFEYDAEKGGNIPKDVKDLGGSKLRIKGFMIPLDQADNISEFALVPSLFACCFGQPPQVQHTIVVHAPKGKAVSYFPEEIIVEGALKVDEKKEDGLVVSVFEINCTSVKAAAK